MSVSQLQQQHQLQQSQPVIFDCKLLTKNYKPIGNLGGGSPSTRIAALLAEPAAELSLISSNVTADTADFDDISDTKPPFVSVF